MLKINKDDFMPITWKPIKWRGLVDNDNHLIRAFVSADKILYVVRDLDRLRGCKSNSSNKTTHFLKQDYWLDHWVKLRKRDCVGTPFEYSFRGNHMVLVDNELADHIMQTSRQEEKETALKVFRNGIQQRARLMQERMKESVLGG